MKLEEREKEIFDGLEKIAKYGILIGGYAMNAYTPPRFSVDCDIALKKNVKHVEEILTKNGFEKTGHGKLQSPYAGEFLRFEKGKAFFDLLVGGILDRQSNAYFPYDFIEKNSKEKETVGRTITTRIKMKIANPEVLFIMKFASCRRQDIRDIFMLSNLKLDAEFIIATIKKEYKKTLPNIEKIRKAVNDQKFKDALQGVYGLLPEVTFETTKNNLLKILDSLEK